MTDYADRQPLCDQLAEEDLEWEFSAWSFAGRMEERQPGLHWFHQIVATCDPEWFAPDPPPFIGPMPRPMTMAEAQRALNEAWGAYLDIDRQLYEGSTILDALDDAPKDP